jgi:hypothetical protein
VQVGVRVCGYFRADVLRCVSVRRQAHDTPSIEEGKGAVAVTDTALAAPRQVQCRVDARPAGSCMLYNTSVVAVAPLELPGFGGSDIMLYKMF